MHPAIVGELRVERGADEVVAANRHDLALVRGQRVDAFTQTGDDWRANEYPGDRLTHTLDIHLIFKAMHLRSEGIALDRDVEQIEGVLLAPVHLVGHEDHAHASAPDGHAVPRSLLDSVAQAKAVHEHADGSA